MHELKTLHKCIIGLFPLSCRGHHLATVVVHHGHITPGHHRVEHGFRIRTVLSVTLVNCFKALVELLNVFFRFRRIIFNRQVFPEQDERIENIGNRMIGILLFHLIDDRYRFVELVIVNLVEAVLNVF